MQDTNSAKPEVPDISLRMAWSEYGGESKFSHPSHRPATESSAAGVQVTSRYSSINTAADTDMETGDSDLLKHACLSALQCTASKWLPRQAGGDVLQ